MTQGKPQDSKTQNGKPQDGKPQDGKPQKTTARGGAVALLNAVLGDGVMLAQALDAPEFAGLAPADRARAQRLSRRVA